MLLRRPACCSPSGRGRAQEGDSYLRLAHLSPDTPKVDVYVASVADPARSFVVPGVGYGAVSPYQPLPAGSYVISMRGAGAPADSPGGHLHQRRRPPRRGLHGGRRRHVRRSWGCRC